jgi:hypothetical protein
MDIITTPGEHEQGEFVPIADPENIPSPSEVTGEE